MGSADKNEIQLKGWAGVIVAILIVLFMGYRTFLRYDTLETDAVKEVKSYLVIKYATFFASQAEEAIASGGNISESEMEKLSKSLEDRIDIVSIKARGKKDEIVIVKVEIRVDGKEPPDGKKVRYIKMRHSLTTGWRHDHEVGKWQYYF